MQNLRWKHSASAAAPYATRDCNNSSYYYSGGGSEHERAVQPIQQTNVIEAPRLLHVRDVGVRRKQTHQHAKRESFLDCGQAPTPGPND